MKILLTGLMGTLLLAGTAAAQVKTDTKNEQDRVETQTDVKVTDDHIVAQSGDGSILRDPKPPADSEIVTQTGTGEILRDRTPAQDREIVAKAGSGSILKDPKPPEERQTEEIKPKDK